MPVIAAEEGPKGPPAMLVLLYYSTGHDVLRGVRGARKLCHRHASRLHRSLTMVKMSMCLSPHLKA
jgi:hypothetical protein